MSSDAVDDGAPGPSPPEQEPGTRPVASRRPPLRIPLAALLAGVVLSLVLWQLVERGEDRADEADFLHAAQNRINAVEREIDADIEVLYALIGLYEASQKVERDEFATMAGRFLARHSSLLALTWIPRVTADERAEFERRGDAEGFFGVDFFEALPSFGGLGGGGESDSYPIHFIEPLEDARQFVGLDATAVPGMQELLERARDGGTEVASGRVPPIFGAPTVAAFTVMVPLYRSGGPVETVEQRRAALRGFVAGTYDLADIFAGALDLFDPRGIEFDVQDLTGSPGSRDLYVHAADFNGAIESASGLDGPDPTGAFAVRDTLLVGGREWEIVAVPGSGFTFGSHGQSRAVLVGALLLTGLIVLYLLGRERRTRRIETLVAARTAELSTANRALDSALVEVQQSSRYKSEFLATMSHEIRTPMNGVIGMTGLLLDSDLTTEQRDQAEAIHSSGAALLTVINDILDFSKMSAGQFELESEEFDVHTAVDAVVQLLTPSAEEKGLDLLVRYGPGVPRRVRGDSSRVRQILFNLVGNAIKFTKHGHVTLNTEAIDPSGDGPTLRFTVHDTGIGIPADQQARIFVRFAQGDASTTRRYGGTGLGLAIARQLVTLMGGEIGVESEESAGSRFWFTLPFPVADGEALTPPPGLDLSDARALIVDTSEALRAVLAEQLRDWGMRACGVADGDEALAALRDAVEARDPYALVVAGDVPPDPGGHALAGRTRTVLLDAAPAVIVLGAAGHEETAAESGPCCSAHLTKPVSPSRLLDALVTALLGGEARQEATRAAAQSRWGAQSRPIPESTAPLLSRGKPPRILLAEDNMVNQRVAQRILERMGCRVDAVANRLEAVQAVEAAPYDLVLMDCQMPEMDGYEATREIRRRSRTVPIIAVTANAMAGDRDRCLAAGMDDYIAKPIQEPELRRILHGFLSAAAPGEEDAPVSPEPGPDGVADAVNARTLANLRRLQPDGGDDLLAELAEMFSTSAPELLAEIREGVMSDDAATVRRAAHTLKGSAANLGAERLATLAHELQQLGEAGAMEEAGAKAAEAEEEFRRVEAALRRSTRAA